MVFVAGRIVIINVSWDRLYLVMVFRVLLCPINCFISQDAAARLLYDLVVGVLLQVRVLNNPMIITHWSLSFLLLDCDVFVVRIWPDHYHYC